MIKSFVSALLGSVLCLSAAQAALPAKSAAPLPKEINVVYVKAPFNLQNIVMKEKGLLEKAFGEDGIQVRWHTIASGAKQAQAMAAGAVDISAVMNTASLLQANGAGNKILIATGVSHPTDTFAIVGKPGSSFSIKELKGKKVAGPRGTVLHQLLVAALAKEGMKQSDVEFISMEIPAAMTAMMAGKIDAALLAASAVIKAEQGGAKVITTAKDLVDVNLVTTVSASFADRYPQLVDKFVQVQRKALEWIEKNPSEALAIGAKEQGISAEDAKRLAAWSGFYNVLTQKDIEGLAKDQDFLLDNKMMENRVDVKTLVMPSALK